MRTFKSESADWLQYQKDENSLESYQQKFNVNTPNESLDGSARSYIKV